MERIKTLIGKLTNQFDSGAGADEMLVTLHMLQTELNQAVAAGASRLPSGVSIDMPVATPSPTPEKVVEVLQIDESAVVAELNELKSVMKAREMLSAANKPAGIFESDKEKSPVTDKESPVPQTLEVHERIARVGSPSLHDTLKHEVAEVSDLIKEPPITDLRKGIGVNDRFTFISELFRGDEEAYEISIRAINGFGALEEAEYWIGKELKLKLGWDDHNNVVHQFDSLVKRRFSRT